MISRVDHRAQDVDPRLRGPACIAIPPPRSSRDSGCSARWECPSARCRRLGRHEGEEPARAYASADLFLFCSCTDTYGQVVPEAGAGGLPAVAVAEGGPAALIENRHTGLLRRPDPDHLAGAVLQFASSPALRERLGKAAVRSAGERSWERALEQLAIGYRRALGERAAQRQARSRAA